MTTADVNSIIGLYVTYYGRSPDQGGLEYWVTQGEAGVTLETMAVGFASVQESKTKYPYLVNPNTSDPTAFVTSIYKNSFGRDPEPGGLAFWVNELKTKGSGQAPTFILTVLLNAQGTDFTALQNKADVAKRFSDGLIENNIIPTSQIFIDSTTILNTIDQTPESVTAGNTAVDQKITAYAGGSGSGGQSFNLTTGFDNLTGTAGDDTFVGDNSSPLNPTVQASDNINGGTGIDTFKYSAATAALPVLVDVEKVQLISPTTGTIDFSSAKGLQEVTLSGTSPAALSVSGLKDVSFVIQSITTSPDITADFAAGTTAKLSVKDSQLKSLTLKGTGVATIDLAS